MNYDEALDSLRGVLLAAAANTRAFHSRSQRQSGLLSGRSWDELAQIEGLLAQRIDALLRRELRAEPWPFPSPLSCWLRRQRDSWADERALVARQLAESGALPIERWRRDAPQLEDSLWPFLAERTEHLANTMARALDEPAPFAAIMWHPGRAEFRR